MRVNTARSIFRPLELGSEFRLYFYCHSYFYKIFLWKEYYYRKCNSKWFYFQYLWQRTLNDAWMWCDGFVLVLGWDDLMLLLLLVSSWFCICSLYKRYLRLLPLLSRDLRHELGNKWVFHIVFFLYLYWVMYCITYSVVYVLQKIDTLRSSSFPLLRLGTSAEQQEGNFFWYQCFFAFVLNNILYAKYSIVFALQKILYLLVFFQSSPGWDFGHQLSNKWSIDRSRPVPVEQNTQQQQEQDYVSPFYRVSPWMNGASHVFASSL